MATPTWEQYMVPHLRALEDGDIHRSRELAEAAADALGLTEGERQELIPSGQARYMNRANWALSHLSRAGAVERHGRGRYRITDVGRQLLARHGNSITERDLRSLPGYLSPRGPGEGPAVGPTPPEEGSQLSPTEQIEDGVERLHRGIAAELLTRLHANDPAFFEQAVVDLIVAMGYGGQYGRAVRTQLTHDGGIDGVVDQDALGLQRVYIQAKRYDPTGNVHTPDIQKFVGALHGRSANQGLFITTARFSSGATQYAEAVPTRVVLIDGERLAQLMIRFGVGVQVKRTVSIVEIDEDFFE